MLLYLSSEYHPLIQFLETNQGYLAIIALAAVCGIALGWGLAAMAMSVRNARMRRRDSEQEARLLAVRTVIALDDFVGACYAAANDSPEFNPSDPGDFMFHMDDPELVLPADIDWMVLNPELVDDILWMPYRIRNVMDGLESLNIDPPGLEKYFEHRQEDFSRLGLRALDLIEKFCVAYDLIPPDRPAYYEPRAALAQKVDEMVDLRNRRRAARSRPTSEPSNITSLFNAGKRQRPQRATELDPNA
jgi:hypothetical protein